MKHPKLIVNLLIYCAAILLISCEKDASKNQPDNLRFFHVYTLSKDQVSSYVHPMGNSNYLIIGNINISTSKKILTLIKADKYGNYLSDIILGDTFANPQVTLMESGELLISSKKFYGNILKLGKNGDVLFNKVYDSPKSYINQNSFPVIGSNGNIYISRSTGNNNDLTIFANEPSKNTVIVFDADGNVQKTISNFTDSVFGGKILMLNSYKVEEPGIFYFHGLIYPYPFTVASNPRLFVSKIQLSGNEITSKKTTILDPNNITNFNKYSDNNCQLVLSDNSLIISTIQKNSQQIDFGYLIKVDNNHNKLWDITLKIGTSGTYPNSVALCDDGGYLITGYCFNNGVSFNMPFACKLNSKGEKIWDKIYPMTGNSTFGSGMETKDGNYLFGGATNSFGGGSNSGDIFLMKTDKKGNL